MLQGSLFKKPKGNVLVTVITTEDQPVLELNHLAKFPLDMVRYGHFSSFFMPLNQRGVDKYILVGIPKGFDPSISITLSLQDLSHGPMGFLK